MTPNDDSPKRRATDGMDEYCGTRCRREDRIARNEEDVQRLYGKIDKILWATLGSAGASILCVLTIVASLVIPLLLK